MSNPRIFQNGNYTAHIEYENWFKFPFEKDFDPVGITIWLQNNWYHSLTISLIYFLFIKLGQNFMLKRRSLQLRTPLFLWNFGLAIFSIFGCLRTSEEFIYVVWTYGFRKTICYSASPWGVSAYWSRNFAISKVVELGDTVFIVLRKRPLLFLHWYHHVSVLVYTWHSGAEHTAAGRWFIWMNYTVHSFMYTYYALKTMNVNLSKKISAIMTVIQLSQMVVGVYVSSTVLEVKDNNELCQQTYENLYLCFSIYFTYFLLFVKFFYDAYVKKREKLD